MLGLIINPSAMPLPFHMLLTLMQLTIVAELLNKMCHCMQGKGDFKESMEGM